MNWYLTELGKLIVNLIKLLLNRCNVFFYHSKISSVCCCLLWKRILNASTSFFIQINVRSVEMVYIQWMNFKVRTSRRNDDFTIHGNFGLMLFCMSFGQIIEILFIPQFRFLLSIGIRWVTYENGHDECYVIAPHSRKDAWSLFSFFFPPSTPSIASTAESVIYSNKRYLNHSSENNKKNHQ